MLVGLRLLQNRGCVDPGLGGEGAVADIGRVPIRRAVEHLVEPVRDVCELLELRLVDADLEFLCKVRLELQRRDQRDEIGIATALAETVERALDLPRAGTYCSERIGDRLLGVVMRMDAD